MALYKSRLVNKKATHCLQWVASKWFFRDYYFADHRDDAIEQVLRELNDPGKKPIDTRRSL